MTVLIRMSTFLVRTLIWHYVPRRSARLMRYPALKHLYLTVRFSLFVPAQCELNRSISALKMILTAPL